MKKQNKSKFDLLFEAALADEAMPPVDNELDGLDAGVEDDLDDSSEFGEDEVTIVISRDHAQALLEVLKAAVGEDEGLSEDLDEGDEESDFDIEGGFGDEDEEEATDEDEEEADSDEDEEEATDEDEEEADDKKKKFLKESANAGKNGGKTLPTKKAITAFKKAPVKSSIKAKKKKAVKTTVKGQDGKSSAAPKAENKSTNKSGKVDGAKASQVGKKIFEL